MNMTNRTVLCFTLMAVALAQGAYGQSAPPAAAPSTPAAAQPATPVEPPSSWSYDAEGRRDPFLSLLGRGNDPRTSGARPPGVAGMLIGDVTVKGILRDRSGYVAMIQSADSKTYIIRTGDRLFDGTVKSILHDKVIFSQDVNDPLSLVKQREIPKAVRTAEGRGALPSL
jgi:Tfp pilus assembly protein PilP